MFQILQTAAAVATPFAFLGLVSALVYFAWTRRLKHKEAQLQTLPEKQRATAIDEYLTRYGIQAKDLSRADRFALIQSEMEKRHRRSVSLLLVAAIVFVACFGLAVFAYATGSQPDTTALVEVMEGRAENVVDTMTKKKSTLQTQLQEGAPATEQIEIISEAIDRFRQLHKEYILAVRENDLQLSQERFSKAKDFLTDSRLVAALNLQFRMNYRTSTIINESDEPEVVKVRTWTTWTNTAGTDLPKTYLASIPVDVTGGMPQGLAMPE